MTAPMVRFRADLLVDLSREKFVAALCDADLRSEHARSLQVGQLWERLAEVTS